MKKNSPNSRPGSLASSRKPNASATRDYSAARVSTQTVRKTPSNTATRSSRRRRNSGVKALGVGVAVVVLVAGVVAGCYFLNNGNGENPIKAILPGSTTPVEQKFNVTLSDGTVKELSVEEMLTELKNDKFFTGISIDGVDLAGKSKNEALTLVANQIPAAPVGVDINLELDGTKYPVSLSTLSLESNYETVVDEAYNFARPAENATPEEVFSCYQNYQLLKTTPKAYTTAYTVNTDGLSDIIHGMLDPLNAEAVEASISTFDVNTCTFTVSESKDGYDINTDKAVEDVKALLDTNVYVGTITVEAEVTKPTVTTEDINNNFGFISETSSLTNSNNDRNHNIRIASETIDGTILQPGEQFSFNGALGQRTPEKGYMKAPTIQGGKSEPDYGGGICQLSTMLYQSVVKADLQVDKRWPHQWPSSYCDPGADAAVDWPSQDFIFTNNSAYPIAIHAFYDIDNTRVTVQIYGHKLDDGVSIDIVGELLWTGSAGNTQYVANSSMAVGTMSQQRSPHQAKNATAYKIWYDANGNEIKREQLEDSYYGAIPEIVEVGVLNPDGSIATMDPSTGAITSEIPTVTEESSEETVPSDTEATETTPAETTPVETTPVETQPPETTPVETTPVETQPPETTPVETTPVETQPPETTPVETTPVETQPPETQATEAPPPPPADEPIESIPPME